jgi:hypothetical protein
MNKKRFIFLAALLIAVSIFGQSPEKISYQAVVRDATNATVANQVVGMKISILQDGTLENPGSAVYVETQTPTTNANGLLSIYIGAGSAVTGTFSGIAWSNVPHYIKIEIDPSGNNTNYTITGTTQLVSVPFALYAKTAGNTFSGDYTDLINQPDNTTAISDETARALAAEQANEIAITTIQTEQTTQNVSISLNSTKIPIPTGGTEGQVLKMVGGIPTWVDLTFIGQTFYEDTDNDGYGDINSTIVASAAPNGYVSDNTDCNDTDAAINPATVWFIGVDTDGDTFFGSTTSLTQCEFPGIGYVIAEPATLDCDDSLAIGSSINPDAIEVSANGIDDNCDGRVDEATVGELRDGGIVFWVDPADNSHGLVCALFDDATQVVWGCYGADLPNVPNVPNVTSFPPAGRGAEIGDGILNTNAILNDCPSAPAALAARSLGPEWFLPSAKELNQMYIHKTTLEAVSGFSAFSNYYWSSTENDYDFAWYQRFFNGAQVFNYKYYTLDVRAVRAF